jgi:uncharacterized protein
VAQSGFVAVLVVDLHFPEAGSLKSKRKELSSIKAQLHTRLGAAVSEVAFQDLWQRARLTAALTGSSLPGLETAADNLERWLLARWPEHVSVQRVLTSVDDLVDVGLADSHPSQLSEADFRGIPHESAHNPRPPGGGKGVG